MPLTSDNYGLPRDEILPHNNFKVFCQKVSTFLDDIHVIAGTKTKQGSKDIGIYEDLSHEISHFEKGLIDCEKRLKEDINTLTSEIKTLESSMNACGALDRKQQMMQKKLMQMKLKNMKRYLQIVINHKRDISTLKFQSMEKMQYIRTSQ